MTCPRKTERQICCEQRHKCNLCQVDLDPFFHIDHIQRRADGGSDDRSNLQALCQTCHARKTEQERREAPVGRLLLASRERATKQSLKRKIDEMLSRGKQQIWGTESIERLLKWKEEDDLMPAAFNRQPVWNVKSQQEFVHVLLNNQITAPIYIMKFDNNYKMELYDGVNRMHTLERFVKGELYIKVDGDIVYFRLPPGSSAKEFDEQQRKLFLRRDLQVAWWSNIDECEACDMALKLNSGTQANMSERLRWITGIATPRCRMLTRLSDSEVGIFFLELCERTVLFSWMGEVLMRAVTNTWGDVSVRVSQYLRLEEFYRSKDDVEEEDRVFDRCLEVLHKVQAFITADYEGQERDIKVPISQLQVLLRLFHAKPSIAVSERTREKWIEVSKLPRMYSGADLQSAVATILAVAEEEE